MPDVQFLIDSPATALLSDAADAATSEVQVAKTGEFQDPRYGKFSITRSDFQKWIKNFKELSIGEGRLGLPVDKDHSPEKKGDTEAVGWIKSLDQRGDELWATVEWNQLGKDLIAERRYAYLSPSYQHNYKDEKGRTHGTALVGVALTNRPFLRMATVNLSSATDEEIRVMLDDATDLDDSTDLDDATDLDDLMLDVSDAARQKNAVVVKKIDGVTKHMFPIPPGDKVHARAALSLLPRAIAAGHITPEEADAIRKRAKSTLKGGDGDSDKNLSREGAYSHPQMPELTNIAKALNLADDANEAAILEALNKRNPEGSVVLSQEQVNSLVKDAEAGRKAAEELHEMRFEGAFNKALSDGKVTPANKEIFHTLFEADADNAIKLLDGLESRVNMVPQGSGVDPALAPETATLAGEFTDSVTPMGIDQEALQLHATAMRLEQEKNISYERALRLAEAGVA